MTVTVIGANVLLSSTMVTAPNAVTSEMRAHVQAVAQSNMPEAQAPSLAAESAGSGLRVEAVDVDHWNAEKNTRFKELALHEALTGLSVGELAELESLTRLRRFARYPRPADEILWQRRQQKVTRNLVEALHAYVEFHEATHST